MCWIKLSIKVGVKSLIEQFQKYENGGMARQQIWKRMGYKYSARTDM
jgi:hypothetical protein